MSKYGWLIPIKDKSGKSVAEALEKILCQKRVPEFLQSDLGREFVCRRTQSVLKKYNIFYRHSRCPTTKAAIVERFIRTIKERLWRYFTHKRTRRYIEILPHIVESYNNTLHSATKMIPAKVTLYNSYIARDNLRKKY